MNLTTTLNQDQLTEAVSQYMKSEGISTPVTDIQFKAGRKGSGVSATITMGGEVVSDSISSCSAPEPGLASVTSLEAVDSDEPDNEAAARAVTEELFGS